MRCRYCGCAPYQISKSSNRTPSCVQAWSTYIYNGIDRIDSSKGYVKGNVVACCGTCNKAKLVMTQPEFLAWVERVYEHSIAKRR